MLTHIMFMDLEKAYDKFPINKLLIAKDEDDIEHMTTKLMK